LLPLQNKLYSIDIIKLLLADVFEIKLASFRRTRRNDSRGVGLRLQRSSRQLSGCQTAF